MKFIFIFVQNIVEFLFCFIPQKNPSTEQINNTKIVAHRGWHNNINILENTMLSFEYALKNKLWGIEFDIRWTKDLVPVVHHDKDLGRVFGSSDMLCRMNFSELRQRFPQVPTLSEVVERFGKKIHFFIEIKEEHYPKLSTQQLALREILKNLNEREDFHFLVLGKSPCKLLADFDLKTIIMVANTNVQEISQTTLDNNFGGMTGHYVLINDSLFKKHNRNGNKLGTGFPKSMNPLKKEINRNIDWIFTNHPWKLMGCLVKLKKNK